MKKLFKAENDLCKNNCSRVVHWANYDLVEVFDGCATPVLKGYLVSGETTALRTVVSVFGQRHFTSRMCLVVDIVHYYTILHCF